MHLYLIRHGIAVDQNTQQPDFYRPLTAKGIHKTQQIAQRLQDLKITFDVLQTSPLTRAQQTAEILHQAGLSTSIAVSELLSPAGSFSDWLTWLETWRALGQQHLALVGHQPNLSEWAEQLIWGTVQQALTLKKAGIIGITLPEDADPRGRSTLFWLTSPKFLL
ncbi:MAG: phosphohistidine phosphatase SixA [Acaryochloridaceae cyanobacterium SU_2_1]|nr:phosphohistidine phosphatase SixA [Acaryochloridaceae cyanobacterium SU_2_1]